jgi:hypothetical protein
MNNKDYCLLIGNNGSFSEFINDYLMKNGNPTISILLSLDDNNLDSINNSIRNIFISKKIISVIYIGGEVRNINRMAFANYEIPKHVSLFCLQYGVNFIYLSSLAAFGNFYRGTISPLSFIRKIPFNEYGKTKQDFDVWIEGIPKIYSLTKIIYPASILGRSHNNSSLQKMINIFNKYPILRYMNFMTIITFCDRSEIALTISKALMPTVEKKFIVAHNLQLSTLRSYLYPELPAFNLPSFIFILDIIFFIPKRFKIFLISSLSEAIFFDNSSSELLSNKMLNQIFIDYEIKK